MNPRERYGITSGGRARMRKYWKPERQKWVGKGGMLGLILICVAVFAAIVMIRVVLVLL